MTLEEQKTGWEEWIETLAFSPVNTKIANQFLLEHTADESILNEAEPQNFYSCTKEQKEKACQWMVLLRQNQRYDDMTRYIKFCWAVGKSTAIYLLEQENARAVTRRERSPRVRAVGKAAVAAMEAEKCANMDYSCIRDTEWLHELAKYQPEEVENAQTMSGMTNNRMKLLLAGILLVSAPYDEARVKTQCEIVIKEDVALLKDTTLGFSTEELEDCARYIEAGDPQAPFPVLSSGKINVCDIRSAMAAKLANSIFIALLGTASFFAQKYDPRAHCAVRLYAKFKPIVLAKSIVASTPKGYLMENLETLCSDLPGTSTTLLVGLGEASEWGMRDVYAEIVERYKNSLPEILRLAEIYYMKQEVSFLMGIKDREAQSKEKLVSMYVKQVESGSQELKAFLNEEGSLKDVAPERMKNIQWRFSLDPIMRAARAYYAKYGWDDFLCRYATALVLMDDYTSYDSYQLFGGDWDWRGGEEEKGAIEFIRTVLEKEMPLETIFFIMGNVSESVYSENVKEKIRMALCDVLNDESNLEKLCRSCQKSNVLGRSVSIEILEQLRENSEDAQQSQKAKQAILSCVGDPSVQIQKELENLLKNHPEWADEYADILLHNKKGAARLLALRVLASFGEIYYRVLKEALEQEKSVKVADQIRQVLGQSAEPEEEPIDIEAFADRTINGTSLKKLQWLLKYPLPVVHKKEGDKAPVRTERIQAILVAYCELGKVGISETAAKLAADLEPADLQVLACEVFDWWMEENAPSKHKWVLAFSAVFGGAAMTPKLRHAITEWPQAARGAIACEAVNALVLSPDPAALMIVDGISRKFKFRQIKKAAAQALENAAHELGIEPEELADRIVPDLGFSAAGKRVFDYGPRQFTVSLTPTLELEIKNDSGKVVKSIPAPGKTDDADKAAAAYSEFKEMKKQIRTTVSAQKERLELALSSLRCWDKPSWEALFVKNPIMHQFAMSLIWGIYEDNKLTDTFRYMEDGSFNTVDEEEYELPEQAKIGLVHPIELTEEVLNAWKQQLADYEITQSIQQLDRPIYRLEEDPQQKNLKRFGGRMLPTIALYGKLQKFGWYRGSIQDAGGYYEFYREDASLGIGVELHFSGACVGYNEDENITVYDAVFYRAGTVERGSYVYDEPTGENILSLGKIPERYYSEVVFQLERATSSSTETDPDWEKECRNN